MEIVAHIGAHATDDDRLLKSILKNGDTLAGYGVKAPGPGKYRRLIRETIQNLNGAPPAENTRQILLDAILDEETPRRLVLSNPNFICIANRIFDGGIFYEQTTFKARGLRELFPQDELTFCIGLRNPATFVPAVFAESKFDSLTDFLQGMRLSDIRWSDMILRLRAAVPDAKVTVWCNEDTPMIWAELIRDVSGLPKLTKITGGFDLLASIMSDEGMNRFLNYMRSHPPQTVNQKHRIIGAFLDKYAIPDAVEETVDLPGLDEAEIDRLSELYEADVAQIAQIPGVTLLTP